MRKNQTVTITRILWIPSRGAGSGIAVTHPGELPAAIDSGFEVPQSEPELDPILLNIPLQLLAYHVTLKWGCDIDKPRNLAKSVTVE
jgi:glucosamine--fructose-6-phosphate aminotransferase (isomerizing)